ncbi:heterokaryon incompatibility protein-domain-containing protein [Pisolithus marmoratus]|nr:heterokaryon incompatibility protein-domain-containing protein [Pisolithus marmoratus]
MRLINIATVLEIETNIDQGKEVDTSNQMCGEFYGPDLEEKKYAILSHCWGVAKEGEKEVTFQEMEQFVAMNEGKRSEIRGRTGYKKIIDTCRQAQKDGLEWVWVDTCCINKESSVELSEAINSMYKWYANSKQCYAYLHDTVGGSWTYSWNDRREPVAIPKWFSRGWTLQELIAPKAVHFFDQRWEWIGDKARLAWILGEITRIPEDVLKEGLQKALSPIKNSRRPTPSVAQIMSWAADRTTTREEDRAYSLLGLFGVHMPMLYGEGKNAFRRLQLEIIRTSNDQSIFAWGWTRQFGWSSGILADDLSCFRDCQWINTLKPEWFTERLRESFGISNDELGNFAQKRLRTFTVTNDGIQMWLPTATFGQFSQVMLGCRSMMTIHLLFCGSTCFRIFGLPQYPGKIKFQQHLLPYKEAEYPSNTFTFELQDQTLSHDGFFLDHVFPNGMVKDGSVTLSSDDDFAAIGYVRKKDDTRFWLLLSYCGGRHSAFAVLNFEQELAFLRLWAFERLSNSNHEPRHDKHLMQHIHFRRSIEGFQSISPNVLVVVRMSKFPLLISWRRLVHLV